MRRVTLLALVLSACTGPQIVERTVEVPVTVTRWVDRPVLPPGSLLAPIEPPADLWIAPTDPASTSCLAEPGEDSLLRYLGEYIARLAALRAWAAEAR